MEPVVSIVIACFNKEQYIGELLDSVLAQSWSNIQLILVDDGSTDSTAAVIKGYEQKCSQKGIEFIFLAQENAGVAIANRNGLKKATGDFVCMPDADDVLREDYVERMARYMTDHQDVQWVVCDSDRTRWTQCINEYTDDTCDVSRFKDLLERYILMCNYGMVWQLMIRTSYLRRTGIIDCLGLMGWTTTHEAPVWIPLILGKGRGVYIPEKLYKFRDSVGSLSNPGSVEKVLGYARRYREAVVAVLTHCGVTDPKYFFLAMLREFQEILIHAPVLKEYVCIVLSDRLIRGGHITTRLESESIFNEGDNYCYDFYYWLWSGFLSQFAAPPRPQGEIVAYGVLGKRGTRMLPVFNESRWKPTKLWDRNGSGVVVSRPDFSCLKEGDTVLVFPASDDAVRTVRENVDENEILVLCGIEMNILFSKLQYPRFPIWRESTIFSIV